MVNNGQGFAEQKEQINTGVFEGTSVNMEFDRGIPFSEGQKREFYDTELSPIKAQILELALVSPEISGFLMKEYNDFLKDVEEYGLSPEVFKKIAEFKGRIFKAKEDVEEEKSIVVTTFQNKCQELLNGLSSVTVDETESEWKNLCEKLNNSEFKCTLEQKSKIQNLLTTLHFFLIMEKIRENPNMDLASEIQGAERSEMSGVIYSQLSRLLNSEEAGKKEVGESIKTSVMLHRQSTSAEEMIFDKSIWEKFAETNGRRVNRGNTQVSSNLPAVIQTREPSLMQRIKNIGRTEIEKITKETVTDEMLEEVARRMIMARNNGECDNQTLKRYLQVADRRLPVYDFLSGIEDLWKEREKKSEFDFKKDDSDTIYHCTVQNEDGWDPLYSKITITDKKGMSIKCKVGYIYDNKIGGAIELATLVDIGEFVGMQDDIKSIIVNFAINNNGETDFKGKKFHEPKIVKILDRRFRKALKEYKETSAKFFIAEHTKMDNAKPKRKKFMEEQQKGVNAEADLVELQQGEEGIGQDMSETYMEI